MVLGVFGNVNLPQQLAGYGNLGIILFLNNLYKLLAIAAGLFAIVNFLLAGYGIMSSSGDPEKLSKAQNKIWFSVIGLIIIVAVFVFARLIGWVVFKDPFIITNPYIEGPS